MIRTMLSDFFKKQYIQKFPELSAILLFVFTTIEFAAILSFAYQHPEKNTLGLFGYFSALAWYSIFGAASFLGIPYLYYVAYNWWNRKFHSNTTLHAIAYCGLLLSISLTIALATAAFPAAQQIWAGWIEDHGTIPPSGFAAKIAYQTLPYCNLQRLFSTAGTTLLAATAFIIFSILLFDINIKSALQRLLSRPRSAQPASPSPEKRASVKSEAAPKETRFVEPRFSDREEPAEPIKIETGKIKERERAPAALKRTAINADAFDSSSPSNPEYPLPSLSLLQAAQKNDQADLKKELKEKADALEETLMSFGIEAKVGQIHCGPTVTMFEVHPAVGVKIGKIKTLENDIALNMEAKSIRIIAPIPGKAAVGIEVPNQKPQEVSFSEVLATYIEQKHSYKIPMLLGKSVNGELVITDLAKMPHCIIAGATGSGKSVCINSIIMSILMLSRPEDIRLLMIDPKKVELTPYTNLPHMLAPVITEPNDAAQALNWLVREMEKRYEILKLTAQRNIDSFNKRKRNIEQEKSFPFDIPEKLPYYVAIVDELADLMMVSSQDIETPIARIAQMARAVGIHLILATQRPSREVITGLIKANFPSRIAFKVASRVNSQIILDDVGAETLLGNGDMLFLLPGSSQLIRCQGVYVRDEEISRVIEDILKKRPTQYLLQSFQKQLELGFSGASEGSRAESLDSLFDEAKSIVFSTGNASTTFLQRKLKIGYARAASLMDQLEDQGIVGPQDGSKPRKIFFPDKEDSSDGEEDPLLEHLAEADMPKSRPSQAQERLAALRDISTAHKFHNELDDDL